MFTEIYTLEEFKSIYSEVFLNRTDKITKISDGSVFNANAFGVAKLAQKMVKDQAIIESHLFPDSAYGKYLDNCARDRGVSQRNGARQSSTFVLVVGTPGTSYIVGTNTFNATNGTIFDIEADYTIGGTGFGYVKVRSRTTGAICNVNALTINQVNPIPVGHQYCINEYEASFGADTESDDIFRKRIKEGPDALSKSTISQLEQVFVKANENVLKVYFGGVDGNGRLKLNILTQNGINLSTPELNDLTLRSEKFFSLCELRPANFNGYGVALNNIQYQPLDISMRLDIEPSYNIDDLRREMQIRMNKYLDYRYWKAGMSVEWDNLLEIAKYTNGVRYVSDVHFFPNNDVQIDIYKIPRIRGFRLMDLNGNIISDVAGLLNPIYYPSQADFSFISSVLRSI